MDHSNFANLAWQVLPSIVANGITTLAPRLGKVFTTLKPDPNSDRILQKESLKPILQKIADSSVPKSAIALQVSPSALEQFLLSPEVNSIVKQIYAVKLTASGESHLPSLEREFTICFTLHMGVEEKDAQDFAAALFESILAGCERLLENVSGENKLSAMEARLRLQHNVLLEEVGLIKRNLDFLTAPKRPAIADVLRFEERFRVLVEQRHGHITVQKASGAYRIAIEDLYVPNTFASFKTKAAPSAEAVELSADLIISLLDRTVVLGNPGAGKSTFGKYVCHTLATKYSDKPIQSRTLTPIVVVLKDYGAEKKSRQCSILQFIESSTNSKYQLPPPTGAIEYLLLNGRALVIFDGLDELLDTSDRKEIAADVESFCSVYPATVTLVTSREVGYEQAPLDPNRFTAFRIAEFDEEQVQTFVTRRFRADDELSSKQQSDMAVAFLEESASVSDLRSNPLLLGLMCDIYRGENYLPRNRPGIYERCALMLFERWDRSRQIDVRITFEDKLSPLLKYLAYWIYSDVELQGGITEGRLIDKATEYLHDRYSEDLDVAHRAARDFIEFCRGRAWVFTDMGVTHGGDPLYQFTHRTFLEYFAAAHLVRIHPTAPDLGAVIFPRIKKREWDIVAQLSFQLLNANVDGGGDQLISLLIAEAKKESTQHDWASVSFAARALEFLMPTPRTVRDVTTQVIKLCLETGRGPIRIVYRSGIGYASQELFRALVTAAPENRPTVTDALRSNITAAFASGRERERVAAFDLALHLPVAVSGHQGRRYGSENIAYWRELSTALMLSSTAQIKDLATKSAYAARLAFWADMALASQIAEWHGVEQLYLPTPSLLFSVEHYPIVDSLLKPVTLERKRSSLAELEALAKVFEHTPPPWVRSRKLGHFSRMRFPKRHKLIGAGKTREDVMFSIFVLLAILLEPSENRRDLADSIQFIKGTRNPQITPFRNIFLARYDLAKRASVDETLRAQGFTGYKANIVRSWTNQEVSFVKPRAKAAWRHPK